MNSSLTTIMSDIVQSCPTNLTETISASARLNCGEDRYGNDQYVCLTNAKKTGLVEFCYKGGIPLTSKGFCVETINGLLYPRDCQHFISGCPSQHYLANEIYRYPACQNINTESQCYFADPSCPNLTSWYTTKDMAETSFSYLDFSYTTANTLPTTTSSLEDLSINIGAVVGGILAGVIITTLLILLCVFFRRRKKRKGIYEEEQFQLLELNNEPTNGPKEHKDLPADPHKADNEDNVPDDVKDDIEKLGIDFLLRMSVEHEKYSSGISHILKVPVELLRMSKEDIKIFVKNYKQGSTEVYCGQGMVVGCFGAGKTTLVKKLKGEDVSIPPESTRGLEVHTNIFTVDEDDTYLTVNKDLESGRLQINIESLVVKTSSNAEHLNPKDDAETINTDILPAITNEQSLDQMHGNKFDLPFQKIKTGPISGHTDHSPTGGEKHDETYREVSVKSPVKDHIPDYVNTADESKQNLDHKIGIVQPIVGKKALKTISLLDFAGQDAYYACHHIFLNPRTFYLLLVDMSKELRKRPTNALQTKGLIYSDWTHQDYINHWLGSIHTYSSENAPVILVQSHSEGKAEKEHYHFCKVLEGVTRTLHVHLSRDRTFAVEKDSGKNIEEIKSNMVKVVKGQRHWGESIPTTWAYLEAYLMEIKKHQKVLQRKDLRAILSSESSPLEMRFASEKDITTALKLFNDIGIILYSASSESIILDVQWFVDAFKNIITDEEHAEHDIKEHFTDWKKFNGNGILSKNLVREIWKGSERFTRYTEDLLLQMIRLGMIAEVERGEKYYVPCMNKQKYDTNVLHNCVCSSIVCFMFEYLPLVIFHRLIATCMTKEGWEIWNGNNPGKTGQTSECMFHTAAILEEKDKYNLKILIGITEKKGSLWDTINTHPYSIEIQGFVFKGQHLQKQLTRSKLERIRKHLNDLSTCFGVSGSKSCEIGYRCSISPFSDAPESHIIQEPANGCTLCRKPVDINHLKSFWMAEATSGNDTFDVNRKNHEKNVGEDNAAQRATEQAGNANKNERNTTPIQIPTGNKQDYTGKYEQNLLQEACRNGKLEMCQHLIQTNPELLHSVDNDGWNAALYAARGGNVKILQLLADKEVDVKHKSNNGWNILHVACLNSNLEMSRNIIQTYPDLIHSVENYGWNAALYAARGGNVEILQLLVDNEVDIKHKNNKGWNILHVACVHSNLEMSRYIIQTYPDLVHSVDNDGWNAALYAAGGGNVKILQLLADKEVDVKHKNNEGWNILHVACLNSNLEISRYIIQTYPDLLYSVDNDGWNAALSTAKGGSVKVFNLLEYNEVDVKHKDNDGWNILHVACDNTNLEMSRYIIQTYPDLIHNVTNKGWNAALYAARGGNVEILQLLADNRVDVKHKSNNGWNILHVACLKSNLEMSRYIIQTYPDLIHSLENYEWNAALYAARGGNVKILQLLSENDVAVKHKNNEGWNILHVACLNSNLEMSRYIIQTYPDLIHSVDNDGRNAASYAARGGNVEILKLLT